MSPITLTDPPVTILPSLGFPIGQTYSPDPPPCRSRPGEPKTPDEIREAMAVLLALDDERTFSVPYLALKWALGQSPDFQRFLGRANAEMATRPPR